MQTLVETRDLWELKYHGDSRMLEYRTTWSYIITNMKTQLPEDELVDKMVMDLKGKSKELELDLADFRRLSRDDPTRTTAFLLQAMDRCIADKITDKNLSSRVALTKEGHMLALGGELEVGKKRNKRNQSWSEGQWGQGYDAAGAKGKKGKGKKGKGKGKGNKGK